MLILILMKVMNNYIYHHKIESWGSSVLIMENTGKAFGRIYWYNDDNITVYLDCLSVDPKFRQRGIGTELQELRENIGKKMGAKFSCLWVKKDSWMHEWYMCRGYNDWKKHEDDDFIWMQKILN